MSDELVIQLQGNKNTLKMDSQRVTIHMRRWLQAYKISSLPRSEVAEAFLSYGRFSGTVLLKITSKSGKVLKARCNPEQKRDFEAVVRLLSR